MLSKKYSLKEVSSKNHEYDVSARNAITVHTENDDFCVNRVKRN